MDELWRINCFKCEFETGGFCVAIFYMDVKIIGRSSGRSATGAAAYRSGEKLQSVAHASYQSGEKLQGKDGKITHDYRKKKGVVHSEILLPDNAPEEYKDRQTLWNTVELSEKRKDAQLAREIIVALPREFDLPEQTEVMCQYVQENFVSKGMITDFALHDTGEGNPHAHIMLTMRNVSRDGFGNKNTDWNKKEFLLSYRKAWTHIINNALERKGLDIKIDHRSYKEQGLDRLPTIHLGHATTALEREGTRTERGDYNRKIQRRSIERAIKEAEIVEYQSIMQGMMELQQHQQEATMQIIREFQQQQRETAIQFHQHQQEAIIQVVRELRQHQQTAKALGHTAFAEGNTNITTASEEPNEIRTTLITAKRMSEPQVTNINPEYCGQGNFLQRAKGNRVSQNGIMRKRKIFQPLPMER
jgi:hypothetical protein